MIPSASYQNYRGPPLVKAILGTDDITEQMKEIYSESYNWQGNLWTFREIFGETCLNKHFRFDFESVGGHDHWFQGFITDFNQYFNPPLATPMNQL
jgi:hypothetical protein